MDSIIQSALSQGLGYGMFCFLLFWCLKQQEKRDAKSEAREEKYQEIISELTEKFTVIESDVKDIKEAVYCKK